MEKTEPLSVEEEIQKEDLELKKIKLGYENNLTKENAARVVSLEHSESIGNIAGALARAQGIMHNAGKSSEGYGYNFADIGANFDAIRKPLSENELAIIHGHSLKNTDKPTVFTTVMLSHSSGEWFKSTLEIPVTVMKGLSIPQSVGVVCTYSRRYLLQAITGLASEDNDATEKGAK